MADLFDAALPGQSLTATPGSMPMERPPQHTDANAALEDIFTKLTMPKNIAKLTVLLKSGTPIEYIVRTILFEGVAQGKWAVDMALMLAQTVFWMVEAVAKLKNVKPKLKNFDQDQYEFMARFTNLLDKETKSTEATSSKFFTGIK